MNNKYNKDITNLNLSIISTIIFILASLISLGIIFDEKGRITNNKSYLTNKQSLNLSFYNRIVILVALLISLYVGYKNYKNEDDNTLGKYKNSLLLFTNLLTVISSLIILYVSYLNKQEQSLSVSDVENPLI